MATPRLRRGIVSVLALGLLLTYSPALAQQIEPPDISFEKYVLPNGLTLILHEDHAVPIVAVNLWYHVGSKNEVTGKTGFAHLFEHMMFQGSENHNKDFFMVMDEVGATDRNGTTNFDRTNYFENVPTNALEQVLWLEADRMGWLLPAMTQERLDNQIEVVKNERRQGVDNQPYGTVDEKMYSVLYPKNHPYSWDVIGYLEDIANADKVDVEEFFQTYYGPNNCTLVVAGDIDMAEAKGLVEKYFGAIPPGPPITRKEVWIPELTKEVRLHMEDRVPLPRLDMAWHIPGYFQPGEADLEILSDIMTSGKNSRLYKKLVYEMNIAQSVSAWVDSREMSGLFWIRISAKPDQDLNEIEAIVLEEINNLSTRKPSKVEVERARTTTLAGFVRGLQRIGGFGGKSDILARYNTYIGDPGYIQEDFARYQEVTPESVRDVAARYLHDGRAVMQTYPYPELASIDDVAGFDRTAKPALGDPPALTLPGLQRATLSNGIPVILAESHKTPVVQVDMYFDGGWSADDKTRLGVASFMARMWDEGTTNKSALEIDAEEQELGAQLNSWSSLDGFNVRVNALQARLDPSLELWADVIQNPAFPQSEIDFQRKQVLGQILQEKKRPVSMGIRILPGILYGPDHPYSQPLTGSGTEETINSITQQELVDFHNKWIVPSNATIMVSGDITMDELTMALEGVVGGWDGPAAPTIAMPEVARPEQTTVYIIDKPGAAQSVLMLAELMPPHNDPDQVPFEVLNTVLGGKFTSRINMNLREDKGYTYGARTLMIDAKGQQMYLAFAQVRTDVTKESISEFLKEITEIQTTRPVTAEELATTQSGLTGRLPGQYESLGEISSMMNEIVRFELDDDYHSTYPDLVRATNTDELTALAKQRIRTDQLVILVVGDKDVIEPGIRELDLGPIEYLDVEGMPVSVQEQAMGK